MLDEPTSKNHELYHSLVKIAEDDKSAIAERRRAFRDLEHLATSSNSRLSSDPFELVPSGWTRRFHQIEAILKRAEESREPELPQN